MWPSIHTFVASAARSLALRGPVYQLGSDPADGFTNAAELKDSFPAAGYIQCQLDPGMGSVQLPLPDGAARTLLWIGPLKDAWNTPDAAGELARIVAPGGAMLVAIPTGCPRDHQSPVWSPAPRTIERLLAGLDLTLVGWQGPDNGPHTLYGVGVKAPIADDALRRVNRFLESFDAGLDRLSQDVGWTRRLLARFARWIGAGCGGPGDPDWHRAQFMVQLLQSGQSPAPASLADLAGDDRTGSRLDAWE